MLRIYSFIIETLKLLVGLFQKVSREDPDLGRQLRRAACSIALNVAEGMGVSGGNQKLRYRTALGSAREVGAALDVAEALGYIDTVDAGLRDRLDRITATLYRLSH